MLSGGRPLPLGGPKQRTVLAALLLEPNVVVARPRLVDAVWGEAPPAAAVGSLQVYVHGLRRVLGGDRIETSGAGYMLRVGSAEVDLRRFERLVERGRAALAGGRAAESAEDLRSALALWRGPALAELGDQAVVRAHALVLEERRLAAVELRNDAELALGRHDAVLAEIARLIAEQPYRERLRQQQILALYRAGRQKEALEAYRSARRALVEELGVEPAPALQELERAVLRQDPSLAAPASLPPVRSRLPAPTTALIGRQLEIAAVAALLRQEHVRLVTLVGSGGTGKTRLAIAVAEELAPELRDGAALVDLAPVADPELLLPSIARVLGVVEAEKPVSNALAEHLGGRSLLLVLDNVEHLLPAAPRISELLAGVPRLRILVTSRAPLRLSGEHEYPVPALPVPAPTATALAELRANEAVRLFAARARAVDPTFALDESNAASVATVCRRLDGLPLAIELAAARAKLLSPTALVERLDQMLDILVEGARDLPLRQQTLRSTLDWSYQLLDTECRKLFRRLAVLAGGFGVEGARALSGTADPELLSRLTSLIDNSLLVRRREAGVEARLDMLETIREYALEQLERSGEAGELRLRHARYFVTLAERADAELTTLADARAHEWLEREHDNLRAALSWAHETRATELELRLAGALARFWLIRGHLREGRRWLQDALERDTGRAPALTAKALRGLAVLALKNKDYDEAEGHLERSYALSARLSDHGSMARCKLSLGAIAVARHELEEARRLYEEAIELARATGERRVLSTAIGNLGDVALNEGDYGAAERLAGESVALARELGHREGAALALLNLGFARLYRGDYTGAAAPLEEALLLAHGLGYREATAYALEGLAAAAAGGGQLRRSARLFGAAEALLQALGTSLEPAERAMHERAVSILHAELSAETLAADWDEGRSMEHERVVREARAVERPAA